MDQFSSTTPYRVRVAIALSGLKTPEFSRQTGIHRTTLWNWENGQINITYKGCARLAKALRQFNIHCSPGWIYQGQGDPPQVGDSPQTMQQKDFDAPNGALSIMKETEYFRSLNPNHLVSGIRDDSMAPSYNAGDYVGGIAIPPSEIQKAFNKNCIATLKDGTTLVRRLVKGSKDNTYSLYALNLTGSSKNLALLDIEIDSVAVVVWHRAYFEA